MFKTKGLSQQISQSQTFSYLTKEQLTVYYKQFLPNHLKRLIKNVL